MKKYVKKLLRKPYRYFQSKMTYYLNAENHCFLYWHNRIQNFGDSINPLIMSHLTGKRVKWVMPSYFYAPHLISIGSILEKSSKNSIVWGAGFISQESSLNEIPKKVCAVRGPRSRKRLLEYGVECPEIYGDPVLLLPKMYSPKIEKKYELGIIPHYIDKDNAWIQSIEGSKEIKIIDLQKKDLLDIVDDILSCKKIASSSLHGVITADAYNIPSVWIKFSNRVYGEGFKFLDYFESVGRRDKMPFVIESKTKLADIFDQFYQYTIDIDLEKLLEAAPFDVQMNPIVRDKK